MQHQLRFDLKDSDVHHLHFQLNSADQQIQRQISNMIAFSYLLLNVMQYQPNYNAFVEVHIQYRNQY